MEKKAIAISDFPLDYIIAHTYDLGIKDSLRVQKTISSFYSETPVKFTSDSTNLAHSAGGQLYDQPNSCILW